MNEYYGSSTTPTDDFLTHYGIRGMKWGVRKAIHKNSEKALSKQYAKAQKKIQKYRDKMDVQKQKNEASYHAGKAVRSAIGTGAAIGVTAIGDSWRSRAVTRAGTTITSPKPGHYVSTVNMTPELASSLGTMTGGFLGTKVLAGKTAYHIGKAIAAKYRSTEKGHKKAVAKYTKKINKFQGAMNEAFKGTSYDASGSRKRKTSSRKA